MDRVSYRDIAAAGLHDWRMLQQGIHARFRTGDFAAGARFIDAIAAAADAANHHPDVTLSYPVVDVGLLSHDVDQVTERDLALAGQISEIAVGQGISADPSGLQQVELCLDSPDHQRVQPFWRDLLAYEGDGPDALSDPTGRSPSLWFQDSDRQDPRQRWHLDVWVPAEQVQPRIDAVLAAGGLLVADVSEKSFWVLEDADGNRSCVCTAAGRLEDGGPRGA